MTKFPRIVLSCSLLGIALVWVTACASIETGQLTTHTSKPTLVDPRADNREVLTDFIPGLVVTMEVDSQGASLTDAQVMMIPNISPRRQEGELVSIIGLSGGKPVTSIQVTDQRINVEEERGIVIEDKRTLHAALPLPQRIDSLELRIPGAKQPFRFDVGERVDSFCRKFPQTNLCSKPLD